jgi:RES domain
VPPDPSDEPAPPLPPADLQRRRLPLEDVPAGTEWWRIHRKIHDPLFFSPPTGYPPAGRFDASDGSFRVCYLGSSAEVSFAETFLRGPVPDLILAQSDLEQRALSRIENTQSLRLVQLHGPGLVKMSATSAVASGWYSVSRPWSLAFHMHSDEPDGIVYRSRHDDDALCAAVYDRARTKLMLKQTQSMSEDALLLERLAERWGLSIIS